MLKSLNSLRGHSLAALDGEIGNVRDALFDDQRWGVRYLVVSTGDWLGGRDVLISPRSIEAPVAGQIHLNVNLTREQVENSPDVDFEKPIPRHFEEDYYRYYGWSPYWVGFPLEIFPTAILAAETPIDEKIRNETAVPAAEEVISRKEMSHLRSAREIEGYHLHATDGDIGHLVDYIINSDTWQIESVVADTRNWWAGKKVVLPVRSFEGIDWYNRLARVRLTRDQIKNSPEFAASLVDSDAHNAAI